MFEDIARENYLALFLCIVRKYSVEKALQQLGIYDEEKHYGKGVVDKPQTLSGEYLLEKLQAKAELLGRTPTMKEMDDDSSMPHSSTYPRKFKSYSKACELAGLTPNKIGGIAR